MQFASIDDIVDHIVERVERAALEINWRSYATQPSPTHRKGTRRGPGLEQHGFKEYDPADGDQASDIDHGISATDSTGGHIIRVYKRPSVTALCILVDVNESLKTGTRIGGFKSFLAAIAAGCGIVAADEQQDKVSVVTVGDQPISFFKLADPRRVFYQAIHACIEDQYPQLALSTVSGNWTWRALLKRATWRSLFNPAGWLVWIKRTASHLWGKSLALIKNIGRISERVRQLFEQESLIGRIRRLFSRKLCEPAAVGGGMALALEATHRELKSVYLVVTDFVNWGEEDWVELENLVGNGHDVITVFVQDKREHELPRATWPGMSFRVQDYRGRMMSLWIVPDELPFLLRPIGKLTRWIGSVFGPLLAKPFALVFGKMTTREQWAENFRVYEDGIIQRLLDSGVTPVVMRTDNEEAVQELIEVLASKSRT